MADAVEVDLFAAERLTSLVGLEQPPLPLWTYGDGLLPTVRVRRGQRLLARIGNGLREHTTIHWHGIRLPNAMDGVPWLTQKPILPGTSFTYDFAPPDAGTFFFHPHCNTAEQLGRGLAGVLVVEGDETRPYDADLVLTLKDWRLDQAGRFLPFMTDAGASRAGTFGEVRTVNGAVRPLIEVPAGGDVRLRLLNVDSSRIAEIGFEGLEAALVAVDGQAIGPLPFHSWRLGPAMRIDLVVRAPAAGGTAKLYDYFAPEPVELATLRSTGTDRPERAFEPAGLIPNGLPEPDLANALRQRCLFSATAVPSVPPDVALPDGSSLSYADGLCLSQHTFWAINRTTWPQADHQRLPPPLARLERGRTYILELVNGTPQQHPIHLHGMSFKVIRPNRDLPVHWADTVLLGPKDRVEVAFVADNPGDWMFHCHIIEHQETGMMGYVRVA